MKKINQLFISPEEAYIIRLLCDYTPQDRPEERIKRLILISPWPSNILLNHIKLQLKSPIDSSLSPPNPPVPRFLT